MVNEIIDAEHVNECLKVIASIREVPNPAYKKAMRDSKAFSPQPGSVRQTNQLPAVSLAETILQRENRHEVKILAVVNNVCDRCYECENCTFAKEMIAIDRCPNGIVQRNTIYMDVK
jgi:hypothetical protein